MAYPIIHNTYRTLMTRGEKGCIIYCADPELQSYLKERLKKVTAYPRDQDQLLYLVDGGEGY